MIFKGYITTDPENHGQASCHCKGWIFNI